MPFRSTIPDSDPYELLDRFSSSLPAPARSPATLPQEVIPDSDPDPFSDWSPSSSIFDFESDTPSDLPRRRFDRDAVIPDSDPSAAPEDESDPSSAGEPPNLPLLPPSRQKLVAVLIPPQDRIEPHPSLSTLASERARHQRSLAYPRNASAGAILWHGEIRPRFPLIPHWRDICFSASAKDLGFVTPFDDPGQISALPKIPTSAFPAEPGILFNLKLFGRRLERIQGHLLRRIQGLQQRSKFTVTLLVPDSTPDNQRAFHLCWHRLLHKRCWAQIRTPPDSPGQVYMIPLRNATPADRWPRFLRGFPLAEKLQLIDEPLIILVSIGPWPSR